MIACRPHRCQWRLVTPPIHSSASMRKGMGRKFTHLMYPFSRCRKRQVPFSLFILSPPTTSQSVFPVVDQRFPLFLRRSHRFRRVLLLVFRTVCCSGSFPFTLGFFCFVLILGLLVRTCSINEDDAYHGAAQATLQRTRSQLAHPSVSSAVYQRFVILSMRNTIYRCWVKCI